MRQAVIYVLWHGPDTEDKREIAISIKRESGTCTMDFQIEGDSISKLTAYALEGTPE
jgi:hypothetical protein